MSQLTAMHAVQQMSEKGCVVYLGPLLLLHPPENITSKRKNDKILFNYTQKTTMGKGVFVWIAETGEEDRTLMRWWLEDPT